MCAINPVAALSNGALPTGGQFTAGAGSISSSQNSLTVNQSTARGIVNWQSFSIGSGNIVQFNNGSGATLNRVTGGDISSIMGTLSATGSVYLINPQGVVVGPNGRVTTGGSFIASTRDISDSNFLSGDDRTFSGSSNGMVVNKGEIDAANGDVVLVGASVRNNGVINAPQGSADLIAGDDVILQPASQTDSGVYVSTGKGNVTNKGAIDAAQVALTAAGGNVYALAGNNGGIIRATGTATHNGHVWLTADGDVTVGDDISAKNADGSGGNVIVSATNIDVKPSATISADGEAQGGTILIGGDRHGGTDPSLKLVSQDVPDAETTIVEAGAYISAAATDSGNGGDIVVWSNRKTIDDAFLNTEGGAKGGNGGFMEVSSAGVLDFNGPINLTAAKGSAGTLLLDPENLTIQTASGTPAVTCTSGVCAAPGDTSILTVATLQSALGSGNVTVNTGSTGAQTGNITVANNLTWANGNLLMLSAAGGITISSGVSISNTYTGSTFGAGSIPVVLALRADSAGPVNGSNVSSNSFGITNSGTINMSGSTGAVSIFNDPGFTAVNGTQTANGSWVAPTNGSVSSQFTTYKLINGIGDLAGITLSGNYALGKSVTGSATAFNSNTPLGTFTGIMDGQYCALAGGAACGVSGYTMTSNSTNGVGLFATNNGIIRNLSLGLTVSETLNSSTTATEGMLAGTNTGTIANVTATSSGSISYTNTDGLLAANIAIVGGLVGQNSGTGTILNSSAADAVTYTYQGISGFTNAIQEGGLVGYNLSTATNSISGSSASGAVKAQYSTNGCSGSPCSGVVNGYVGGLIGQNGNATATATSGNSATNNVTSNMNNGGNEYVGGLIGYDLSTSSSAVLNSSTSTGAPTYTGTSTGYLGGLIGDNASGTIGSGSTSSENVIYSGATSMFVGGLAGYNGGTISSATATGNTSLTASASVTDYVAGLVGFNVGTITGSSASTGSVNAISTVSGLNSNTLYAGGLAGANADPGSITSSSSSENVTYTYQGTSSATSTAYVGGLLGSDTSLLSISVAGSSSTGNVTGQYSSNGCSGSPCTGNVNGYLGGLVGISGLSIAVATGQNFSGSNVTSSLSGGSEDLGGLFGLISSISAPAVTDSYAIGDVTYTGTSTGALSGGLIGNDALGGIANSYAAGAVNGGVGTAGGLIASSLAAVVNSYWDAGTTGQSTSAGGTSDTTAQLQASLPTGFSSSIWGIIPGTSYPYFLSQFSGTPQVLAGTVFSDHGSTILANANVAALLNGIPLVSTLASIITTDKNGYYYYLLAPGTISGSGSQALVYLTGTTKGETFLDGATGSVVTANIYGNYLSFNSNKSAVSTMVSDLSTALGSNSGANFPFTIGSGVLTMNSGVNLQINANATSTTLDDALNLSGGGVLDLNGTGSFTESAAITAPNVLLQGTSATYTLTGATNAIGTLAVSVGAGTVSLNNGATNLAVGAVNGVNGITAESVNLTDTGTVTETQGVTATNVSLQGSGGTYTLTGATNAIGTLAANVGAGTVSIANGSTNLSLGTVNSINGVIAGALNLTDTGTVTQTQAIAATNVSLQGSGGTYTLTGAGNAISTLATSVGAGTVSLNDGSNNLSIDNVNSINGATAGTLNLTDTGTVTQTQAITATNLSLQGVGGAYTLTGNNAVSSLAGNTGTVNLTDTSALSVNTVNGVSGLTTTGNITLSADSMAFANAISAAGQTVTLQPKTTTATMSLGSVGTLNLSQASINNITAGTVSIGNTGDTGTITVGSAITVPSTIGTLNLITNATSPGIIIASGNSLTDTNGNLVLQANGVSLSSTAGTLSTGSGTGSIAIQPLGTNATPITLTTTGAAGMTFGSSGSTNNLSGITTGNLTLGSTAETGTITSSGGAIAVPSSISNLNLVTNDNAAGAISFGSALSIAGNLNLNVNAASPTVTQTAAITVGGLSLIGAGATYALAGASNNIGTLAANAGGTVSVNNGSNNLVVGTVNGTVGVTAPTFNLTGTGVVTETQAIAATNLSLQGSGGTFTLTGATNTVGTLAASVGTGTVSLADGTNLSIGGVNGINGVTAGTLNLTDTGTMSQTQAVTATNLSVQGSGATVNLTGAINAIGNLAANIGTSVLSLANGSTNLAIGTVNSIAGVTAGTVNLTDTGSISESQGITAANLSLQGTGAIYNLSGATNAVSNVAASIGTGTLSLANGSTNLAIGTVNSVNGITAGTVNLNATGTISETKAIASANLSLQGAGATYNLTGATNTISTLAASVGTGTISLADGATNLSIGTVNGVSGVVAGTLNITDTGAVTQTQAISANLSLQGSGGAYTLTNASNNIGVIAANTGTLTLNDNASGLIVGTVNGVVGITTTGATSIVDSGTLTLNNGISSGGGGTSISLGDQVFTNNDGSGALSAGAGGRFLVWSSNPANDNRGGIAYAFKQYNATLGVTTVAQTTGNGFLYSLAPIYTVSLTGTVSKTYDGTNTATLTSGNFSISNSAVDGDTVTISTPTSGTYSSANAGSGLTVSTSGIAITSATNGAATVYGYQVNAGASASIGLINKATLTGAITANNKVYDGTTTVTLASIGLTGTTFGSDGSNLTITDTAANFNSKDVLTANTVTATGLALSGSAAGNYQLSSTTATALASITAANLTGVIVANNKVYNGTTAATLASLGFTGTTFGGDASNLSVSSTGATFNTKDVLTANTVTATGLTLTGSASSDYHLVSTTAQAAASITAAPITGVIVANSKVYDGTTSATLASLTASGVLAADASNLTIGSAGATFNTKDVLTANTVTAAGLNLGGTAANDYALVSTTAQAAASITPATLTGTITANNKVYDGTTSATLSAIGFTGTTFGSDSTHLTVTDTSAAFNTKDVLTANTVTALGLALDGTAAGDYVLASTSATASANITPATLTGTITANNKVYDGTTTATLSNIGFTGTTFGTDSLHLSVTDTAANFNTKDVLTANTVTATGLALGGTAASDYQLALTTATAAANITPATLTGTIVANNKVYDGTTTATLASIGFTGTTFGSDSSHLTITDTSANFNTKDVLTANTVTAAGLALGGTAASDYQLASTTAQAAASITPATLTGTITANNKVYDGTTTATLSNISFTGTTFGTDGSHLSITDTAANFNTKDVLTANTVTATGLALSGTAAGDYQLSASTAQASASIMPATLTGTIVANNKVYDGTTTATLSTAGLTGSIFGNDASNLTITATSANFNTKDVLTANLVTATGLGLSGLAAGDYQLSSTSATATAHITAAAITPVIVANTKVYDGTTTATLASETPGGVLSADINNLVLTNVAANFNTKDVLTANTVTVTGLALAGSAAEDYALASASATVPGHITPATLIGTITANNKVYDGTNTATLAATGFTGTTFGSDSSNLSVSAAGATFNSKDVLTATTVTATGLALGGIAASDYQLLSTTAQASGSITPATITGTITANNKVYDGTTTATLSSIGFTGTTFGSDGSNLTIADVAANFNTKDVLTANTVTATGLSLSGLAASDYQLSSTSASATAHINAATITPVVVANNKIYDGSTTASLSSETPSGALSADINNLILTNIAANFNTKDVLTANTVTVTGIALSGSAAGDYALASTSATVSAHITPATLTATITANNKVYDGTTAATLSSAGFTGSTFGNDSSNLSVSAAGATFNSKDVLTANTVTATGLSLSGTPASDYKLATTTAQASAHITPATLTSIIVANNKVYDGTTAATLSSIGFTGTTFGSDGSNLSVAASAANFNSKDVPTATTVTATGLSLFGLSASDYQLSSTSATALASISTAPITPVIVANNKVFDGTTTATLASATPSGVIAADKNNLTLSFTAANFNSPNVATATTVTATGGSLSGTAAIDYSLTTTTASAAASITPAPLSGLLVPGIVANNKVYDGTTTAAIASTSLQGVLSMDVGNVTLNFAAANFNSPNVATATTVTATGLSLVGSAATNYALSTNSVSAAASITPAPLTGTIIANNKVYDGTTNATLSSTGFTGTTFGGDSSNLTVMASAANFNSKDVATATTVTATGLALTGLAAANYALTSTSAQASANITPASVTASITANNKVYNGTTTATLLGDNLSGIITADINNVSLNVGAANFNTKDVLTATTVTATGLTLGGTLAADYQLASNSATASASITPATLAGAITANNKVYDGAVAATLSSIGFTGTTFNSDGSNLTVTAAGATFNSKNVTTANTVTATGLALGGTAAGDYQLAATTAQAAASITPAPITGTIVANNKVYDGTTNATLLSTGLTGTTFGSDSSNLIVTASAANFNTKDVATANLVTATGLNLGGSAATNYALTSTSATAAASITPATVTAGITANNKVYDGTTTATISGKSLGGIVAADMGSVSFSVGAANFNSKDVAAATTVTATGLSLTGALATDYQLASNSATTSANITPATISGTITANNKVYDGTTVATLSAIGFAGATFGSDSSHLTVTDLGATFNSKDVLTANSVTATGLALSGTAAGDYQLASTTAQASANVTPATITGTITANNKVYDGTTTATLSGTGLTGTIFGSDASHLTVTDTSATFNTKDVLTANTVTAVGLALSGAAASDYQLAATTAQASANITPATITASITANNKVYNGTTTATLSGNSLSGVITADVGNVSLNIGAANFNSKDVTTATTVTATGLTLSGTLAADYQLASNSASAAASITPATLTGTITASNKVYDGTISATITGTGFTGSTFGSDSSNLTVTDVGATFNSKDVLTANTVTATGLALSGAAAGDYQLSATIAQASASITPAMLTGTVTANNKVYDGTTTATLSTAGFTGSIFGSDANNLVVTAAAANFNTKDVATATTVTATGLGLSGSAASDYQLSSGSAVASAHITAANITPVIVANNKVYDGTTTATLSSETPSGVLSADINNLVLTNIAANFNTKDVLTANTVTVTGLALSGSAAGDYALLSTSATTPGHITPATITGTIVANNKVYDGTTAATLASTGFTGTTFGTDGSNLTVTDTAANFNTKDVLTANTVTATGLALGGAAAGDYQLSSTSAVSAASITPATLSGVIVANNKVYDGTTAATLASIGFTGTTYGTDSSHLTVTDTGAAFNSKDVLTANTVTASGLALSGTAASDYQLASNTAQAAANITPATITGTITAHNKVYDGTTTATLTSTTASGVLAADAGNVTLTSTAANFNSKDVATANNVVATGLSLSGAAASDYQLASTSASAAANITPAFVTGVIVANNKVYDGTTNATLASATVNGVFNIDQGNVVLNVGAANFNSKDVQTANTVTATGLSLSGAAAGDYQLLSTSAVSNANITPASLTPTITANNKVYDGTTAATLASTGFTGTIYGSDASNLTLNAAAVAFNSQDVVTANTVTASGLTLGGAAAGDYHLSTTSASAPASITPATLTVVSFTVANKNFDGTDAATITSVNLNGVLSTDANSVGVNTTQDAAFTSDNPGNNLTVNWVGTGLTGPAAGNYRLSTLHAPMVSANIIPFTLPGGSQPTAVQDEETASGNPPSILQAFALSNSTVNWIPQFTDAPQGFHLVLYEGEDPLDINDVVPDMWNDSPLPCGVVPTCNFMLLKDSAAKKRMQYLKG